MSGTTGQGYPYALPADPLVQWPATSQQLAQKIDGKMQAGIVTYTGVMWQQVTFPYAFTTAPKVIAAVTDGTAAVVYVRQRTTTGFQFAVVNPATDANTGAANAVQWIAML